MKSALVLLSGGQDSATCLHWAIRETGDASKVKAVIFDYGQRHRVEIDCAVEIAKAVGIEPLHLDVPILSKSSLVHGDVDIETPDGELPNTFVPGRNLIFLTLASAAASTYGITDLVTGVCETDYSGYPDCRQETITALERALQLGTEMAFLIHTPLMHLTKAQTWALAGELDVLDIIRDKTLTCYEGVLEPNDWGRGCGVCPACVIRLHGYHEYQASL